MERKAFSNQLELLGGETPHTPRASLAEAQWEPLRILRAGLDPGGRAPGWGLGGGRAHPVLETAPGGVRLWSQNPGAASPSSPSEAWRRFPGPVPFQPVSILKPGDNERLVSGASVFFFFPFFPQFTLFLETVEPVAVEAEGSGTFSFVWQQLLFREADAAWICFFPGSTHAEAFAHEAGRTGIGVAGRGKAGLAFRGRPLYL